jgi:glyoxylase-like metal-dependent hydrolase (beta-lactamase superfamily II)
VLCSRTCGENIRDPGKNMARLFRVFCEMQTWMVLEREPEVDEGYGCMADETFEGETDLDWRGHRFHLFELPGHSQGGIGIMLDGDRFFSGDSLMEDSVVELRLPGGSRKQWAQVSLPRLRALPENIRVCPGHFGEFTLDRERRLLRGLSV